MDIVLLPLGYLNGGTRDTCITSGYITNGCVTSGTRCDGWETLCSNGKFAVLWNFMIKDAK